MPVSSMGCEIGSACKAPILSRFDQVRGDLGCKMHVAVDKNIAAFVPLVGMSAHNTALRCTKYRHSTQNGHYFSLTNT